MPAHNIMVNNLVPETRATVQNITMNFVITKLLLCQDTELNDLNGVLFLASVACVIAT